MAIQSNRHPKRIRWFLLSVIVVIIGILVAILIGYRKISNAPEIFLDTIGRHADASLGSIDHTATRDGLKEWTLKANSARLIGSKKHMVLQDLSIIYYMKDGQEVYLTANEGILHTESNDIEVSGNVVLISEPYELQTEKMHYLHDKRQVFSKSPVKILSLKSYLGADAMTFDINSGKVQFKGNVEGIFAETIGF